MKKHAAVALGVGIAVVLLLAVAWRLWVVLSVEEQAAAAQGRAVPVEVARVERGAIELRRTFSGTLESTAEFSVAPKVSGRIESLKAALADELHNGDVVATLDSDEYTQELRQAEADLAVAEATLAEARSGKEIADRTMARQSTLRERGVASDAQFDTARAEQLSAEASLAVAEAQLNRAQSAVETARIRLSYTQVRARWTEGDTRRVVAQRMVEEGDTVAANTPLIRVVELDPIRAVIYVAERDYALLTAGQKVNITTDAYADRTFEGVISRVSPVFESNSRQARVELRVPNPDRLLKPGMFVRATAVLRRVEDTLIVPEVAVIHRANRSAVFVIDPDTATARLVSVETGIADAGRLQVTSEGLSGLVVTLGQPLLDDGSPVKMPDAQAPREAASPSDAEDG